MKKKDMLLAVSAALATVTIALLARRKYKMQEGKPPRNAPQVQLSNPGEQSEFTTTASESELG